MVSCKIALRQMIILLCICARLSVEWSVGRRAYGYTAECHISPINFIYNENSPYGAFNKSYEFGASMDILGSIGVKATITKRLSLGFDNFITPFTTQPYVI